MPNARPTPNRRRRETNPEEEARIAAFAQQADTLQPAPSEPLTPQAPSMVGQDRSAPVLKASKDKSYTFRMTEGTLNELREAAADEERSIQWIFDRILLPALRERRATK